MATDHDLLAADQDLLAADRLLSIEISPALPCGMGACGQLASHARIERDLRYVSLWRLLPICDTHLRSLQAAANQTALRAGASSQG